MPTPVPSLRAFLIADQVFQQASGKWCIIGVFHGIAAHQFPVVLHTLGLYVSISDAEGDYEVRIEFRDARDQALGRFDGMRIHSPGRLATVGFGIQANGLRIPSRGRYFFRLSFNGTAVQDIPIDATDAREHETS